MENTQVKEEKSFSERAKKIEIEQSVKLAKLQLLMNIEKEIEEEVKVVGGCMCCGEQEITYLECKSYIDGLLKTSKIVNEQIKKLKIAV